MLMPPLVASKRAPGPAGHPLLGSALHFRRDPVQFFMELQQQFGGVAQFKLGPTRLHMLCEPDAIRYVLQENCGNYVRGPFYRFFQLFMGEGLFNNDGEIWLHHRRIDQPPFHRASVAAYASTMTQTIAAMLDRWQAYATGSTAIDVLPEMLSLSIHIIGRTLFSTSLEGADSAVGVAARTWNASMIKEVGPLSDLLPRWLPTAHRRQVWHAQHLLNTLADRVIAEHRQAAQRPDDFVTMLLDACDAETGAPISDVQIRDDIKTMLLAGHETTGTGLAWTLYALARYPAIRQRLEHELSSVLGERVPTVDDLAQLPYLSMVVDEALRLYPPIWGFVRAAVADDTIGGYHIPAGSTIFVSPYVAHRHPAFWDNPEAFDPERFTPERAAQRPKFAYLPFGGGPRQCIGKHFGLLQMQLTIAMIVQRYRLELAPGCRIKRGALLSLHPLHGIMMTLHPRER